MAVPTGYSGSTAVAAVQNYTDEYTYPATSVILGFLNKGLEDVSYRTGGPKLWAFYPTEVNQTTVQLNNDVEEVISANFSIGANNSSGTITTSSPFSQGSLVYPMMALEQAAFMDAAAGFPAVGFGPPQAYFVYQDEGYNPTTTLPVPSAPSITLITGISNATEYEVVLTYVNTNASGVTGETTQSAVTDYTPTTAQQGQISSPKGISNATGYNVYVGNVNGPYYLQNTSGAIALGTPYTLPGTPTLSGTQPPGSNTATGSGAGGALSMQLYPAAMLGQVNVYYKARPQLWADTTTSSWTNLDTTAQEAAVIFAVMRVLANRSRQDEIPDWRVQYEGPDGNGGMIARLKAVYNRRFIPRSGQVRDVTNRSFPSSPYWMTSP